MLKKKRQKTFSGRVNHDVRRLKRKARSRIKRGLPLLRYW